MKRIILWMGLIVCGMSAVYAQKVKRPALLYTPERIAQVKQRMEEEPKLEEAWL